MSEKDFDNYSFSMYTEINYQGSDWDRITEVNFDDRTVGIVRGQIVNCNEIRDIRN